MNKLENKIGLGTSAIGRPVYINVRKEEKEKQSIEEFKKNSIEVLDKAYQLGVRYFDTAPGYGFAEELLENWVRKKQDSSIEVATKWGYTYTANFNEDTILHEVKEHSLEKLNEQWEVSKRLLPYLKYYQIHSATLETGVLSNELILRRLYELKKVYGIQIGLTTTGANQSEVLEKALNVKIEDEVLFEVFQCTYNILDQNILNIGEKIIQLGKRLVLKETLANGRLFPTDKFSHYHKLYSILESLAKKYEVGIDAIALNFCLQTLPGALILSGASKTLYLNENLKINKFKLSSKELDCLRNFQIEPISYWKERKQLAWN
ncbi:hypothetical protein UJ101_02055 [Flavobacteriaceae bacterium UJ101]|nr:hypothetical protein UJ101_02055 [Flavobacteriaceae bacterium UJ101]